MATKKSGKPLSIKDILKQEGRSQDWLMNRLRDRGLHYSQAEISLICRRLAYPKKPGAIEAFAKVLDKSTDQIKSYLINNGTNE